MNKFCTRWINLRILVSVSVLLTLLIILGGAGVQASTSDEAGGNELKGIVENKPDGSLIGSWLIDGVEYMATRSTKFKQNEGPLVVDSCVKVKYVPNVTPHRIIKIETEEAEECQAASENEESTDEERDGEEADDEERDDEDREIEDSDDDEGDEDQNGGDTATEMPDAGTALLPTISTYGIVSILPSSESLEGVWIIGDVEFIADEHTRFDRDYGDLAEGKCVEVKYTYIEGEGNFAREIETERAYKCSKNSEDRPSGVLFGVVQGMPEGKYGDWNIAGLTFLTDQHTKFKIKKHVPLAEGINVKVKFYLLDDGTHYANTIETKFRHGRISLDDDKDDQEKIEGDEPRGHAFGSIESLPANLIGQWMIGGIAYTATVQTSFIQKTAIFSTSVKVRVNYTVNEQGKRTATLIKTINDQGTGENKFYGYLKERPASGFLGQWMLDSLTGNVDLDTIIDESLGLIGEKAYVEVDYTFVDHKLKIHKIKVHVPPGAGDNDSAGAIESIGGEVHAASVAVDETWVINGTPYRVTLATEINEEQGPLGVGSTVSVNSYTAEDGSEVATQIGGISFNNSVYLPFAQN